MYSGSDNIHLTMIADRYRVQQDFIRGEGIKRCETKNLAVETHAGVGNLTKLYKANFFEVLTNDINPKSEAVNNMKAIDFIYQILPGFGSKIDFIDVDAYGSPSEEVKALFEHGIIGSNVPVVLCISDGLGLWMKRSKKVERIIERYLLDDFELDRRYPWRQHEDIWLHFMNKLCLERGLRFEIIQMMQTKGKNYVLASFLIIKA